MTDDEHDISGHEENPLEEQHDAEEKERDRERDKIWTKFWLPLLHGTDGRPSLEKIKDELCDFYFVMQQVPKVYCHITGNKLSKLMYKAETVINEADEHYESVYEDNEAYQRGLSDGEAKARREILQGEPDGYAAYDPKGIPAKVAWTYATCERLMIGSIYGEYEESYQDRYDAELKSYLDQGWTIKPVRIIAIEEK